MPSTSGTYTYLPDNASLVLQAYSRCGLRRTSFVQEHMVDARNEINLMFASWANMGVNLWTMELETNLLTQGVIEYTCLDSTIMMLDTYIETGDPAIARIITGIGRSDYAAIPNKTQQGAPNSFWFNRGISPTFSVWPAPDGNAIYTLKYWRIRQIQDANLTNGEIPEIPYRWVDAFVAGLAARLAAIYAPDRMADLERKADLAYKFAAEADVEHVPLSISPVLDSYYR